MNRILSIVKKDIRQILSNRFIATITFLAIIAYAVVYHLMPANVNESFEMGLYLEKGRAVMEKELAKQDEEGLKVKWADSEKKLKKWVEDKDVQAGFAISFSEAGKPSAKLFVSSETPAEIKEAGEVMGAELANNIAGNQLPIDVEEEIIGIDRLGEQIPLRNDMRILFLVVVLAVEIFALSDLLVSEVEHKTVFAVLATPVSTLEFMGAKTIVGVLLAVTEGLLAAALLNVISLGTILPLIFLMILGAFMATSVAFILGALSRNAMSVMAWGTVVMIVFMIPSTALMFPGFASPVIKAVPTYPLAQALDGIVNRGSALADFSSQITYLTLISVAFFAIGFATFKRRLA